MGVPSHTPLLIVPNVFILVLPLHVDNLVFSKNDISVLEKLVVRRELIDARSEELALQEGLLGAAEKRIDKKILELKILIVALEKTIKKKE